MATKIPVGEISRKCADILRTQMQQSGMTLAGLGASVGLSEATVSRMFTGLRSIEVEQLDALAVALGLIGWQVLYEAEVGESWDGKLVDDPFVLAAQRQPEDPEDEAVGQYS